MIKTVRSTVSVSLYNIIYGTKGNATITTTGTTNASVSGMSSGAGIYNKCMPGFIQNVRNKIASNAVHPYQGKDLVQIILDFTIDTSTYGSAAIKINQSNYAASTTDSNGLTITPANGRNRMIKYLVLDATTPSVSLNINQCAISLHQFQIKTVFGKHLTVSSATNEPTYVTCDSSNSRQTVNAVKAVASGTPAVLVTRDMLTQQKDKFKAAHTIGMVISSDGAYGNSHIVEVIDSSRVYLAIKSNHGSSNDNYYAHTTEGSGSAVIADTKLDGHFQSVSGSFNSGRNNVIIAIYDGSADTYKVYGNGSVTATTLTSVDMSSIAAPQIKIGAQNGISVKELVVFDSAFSNTERQNLVKYMSYRHNVAGFAGQLSGGVISTNAYLIPTTKYNAIYKTNAIGDIRSSVGSASYTLYAEQFTDSTPTKSTESTSANVYLATAKIKALGFVGGSDGATNGADAWTVKIVPSGGSAAVIDEPITVTWKALTTAASDYTIQTRYTATKGSSITLSIDVVRASASGTSDFIFEVTDLHINKAVRYLVPTTKNSKTVLAKVKTPSATRLFYRTADTVLSGYANTLRDAAKAINPLTATSQWTEISSALATGNLENARQNIDGITGQQDVLNIGEYYTKATLTWSEFRRKFVSFYDFVPELYLRFKNTYLSYSKPYDTANTNMNLHNHNKSSSNFGEFYGTNYKSSIFIPVNEVAENQKTLYTAIVDGAADTTSSFVGKFSAVNVTGNEYLLVDATVSADVNKKDDFYTITPQSRVHGKAFVVRIESASTNTTYIKIKGIIVRARSEAPNRNLLSKQNPFKGLTKKK